MNNIEKDLLILSLLRALALLGDKIATEHFLWIMENGVRIAGDNNITMRELFVKFKEYIDDGRGIGKPSSQIKNLEAENWFGIY